MASLITTMDGTFVHVLSEVLSLPFPDTVPNATVFSNDPTIQVLLHEGISFYYMEFANMSLDTIQELEDGRGNRINKLDARRLHCANAFFHDKSYHAGDAFDMTTMTV